MWNHLAVTVTNTSGVGAAIFVVVAGAVMLAVLAVVEHSDPHR